MGWKRIRWSDAKFEVTGVKCDLRKEHQPEKRDERKEIRQKREDSREGWEKRDGRRENIAARRGKRAEKI